MCAGALRAGEALEVPVVVGDWWQIAPNAPDVGKWSTGKENACDFTVFPSKDGRWHCIACIRGTSHFGQRLLYHWTSEALTETNWGPVGIFDAPRNDNPYRKGEEFSIQAPHGFWHDGRAYLFYNSGPARALVSDDGRDWSVFRNTEGEEIIFQMGRDVMLFHDAARSRWIAYYTGTHAGKGAMVARTASRLAGPWSKSETPVKTTGNPESPFVLRRGDRFYLFQQMEVYCSQDPLRFEGQPVTHLTGIWYSGKWAPEVVVHEGNYYVAGYGRGIWLAEMQWETRTHEQIGKWRKKELAAMRARQELGRRRREEKRKQAETRK